MQRDAKAFLWDIANAASSIQSFTAGKDLDAYLQDELLRSAVERKFGIIGEEPSLNCFAPFRTTATKSHSSETSSPFATRSFTVMQQFGTTWCGRSSKSTCRIYIGK